MAPVTSRFTLSEKKSLTHDVFELIFSKDGSRLDINPGQYILFVLPSWKRRAYSIAFSQGNTFHFIIKRLPHEWAGSAELCDMEIGHCISGMGPIGHFVLSEKAVSRAFLWTGTGFAPLYYQVRALESRGMNEKAHFVFGVRFNEDMFYQEEFERLAQDHQSFTFTQFLSKGIPKNTEKQGYVGDILTSDFISQYEEFYLCGSPEMVKGAREKLGELGVSPDRIRFEQF
jgi:NAD(P)H-flavin reductase